MNPALLVLGGLATAWYLLQEKDKAKAAAAPGGGGGGSSSPGFQSMTFEPPPSDGSGRAWLKTLGELATEERDEAIFQAITSGFTPGLEWTQLASEKDGRSVVFQAANGPLMVGTSDPIVVSVSHRTAQRLADHFNCVLPTTRMSDLAWLMSDFRLLPQTQTADSKMANTSRMIQHSDALHKAMLVKGAFGLVRPGGKDWVTTEKLLLPDGSVSPMTLEGGGFAAGTIAGANFGWHFAGAGLKSPGGLAVAQSVGRRHDYKYTDYSQTVTLYQAMVDVDGMGSSHVESVLADPDWAYLLSDEVARGTACRVTRHPAVSRGDGAFGA